MNLITELSVHTRRAGNIGVAVVVVLLALGLHAAWAQQLASNSTPDKVNAPELGTIVARMQQARLDNHAHYRAYTITREYRLYAEKDEKDNARVVADVSFVPPDQKTFVIEKAEGNEHGTSVVQRLLERESQTTPAAKNFGALTPENYSFTFLGTDILDGQLCWLLGIHARRDDRDLINGKIWVDPNTYLVHRADGDMARTPSWWLKKVHLTLDFRDVSGMWLQTSTYAIADVHFFGRHVLTEEAIRIQTSSELGQASRPMPEARPVAAHQPAAPNSPVRRVATKRRPSEPVAPPLFGTGILTPR